LSGVSEAILESSLDVIERNSGQSGDDGSKDQTAIKNILKRVNLWGFLHRSVSISFTETVVHGFSEEVVRARNG